MPLKCQSVFATVKRVMMSELFDSLNRYYLEEITYLIITFAFFVLLIHASDSVVDGLVQSWGILHNQRD